MELHELVAVTAIPEQLRHARDSDKATYRVLALCAFNDPTCWPSQALVGRLVGRRRETVNRSCSNLKRLGVLSWVQHRRVRGLWRHNVYTLHGPWSRPYRAPLLTALRAPMADFIAGPSSGKARRPWASFPRRRPMAA
jgi:hypothetical protein